MSDFDSADDDPVEEIRRIRDAHAAKFNDDLDAIFRVVATSTRRRQAV